MKLPKQDIELFFEIYSKLLQFVIKTKKPKGYKNLLSKLTIPMEMESTVEAREFLLNDTGLISKFLKHERESLSQEGLTVLESWKNMKYGQFFIERVLKKHVIFLETDADARAYGVIFLNSDPSEVINFTPKLVKALLLPWKGKIIYDGLLIGQEVSFGPGIKNSLKDQYREAKENGIITCLENEPLHLGTPYKPRPNDSNVIQIR